MSLVISCTLLYLYSHGAVISITASQSGYPSSSGSQLVGSPDDQTLLKITEHNQSFKTFKVLE